VAHHRQSILNLLAACLLLQQIQNRGTRQVQRQVQQGWPSRQGAMPAHVLCTWLPGQPFSGWRGAVRCGVEPGRRFRVVRTCVMPWAGALNGMGTGTEWTNAYSMGCAQQCEQHSHRSNHRSDARLGLVKGEGNMNACGAGNDSCMENERCTVCADCFYPWGLNCCLRPAVFNAPGTTYAPSHVQITRWQCWVTLWSAGCSGASAKTP
jgi:hypothetical protein